MSATVRPKSIITDLQAWLLLIVWLVAACAAAEQRAGAQLVDDEAVPYLFPHFPYKETVANEKQWSEYESACEQSGECVGLSGVLHLRCVRECVAPVCYNLLYRHDELEEGEVDVRLNSFKGCFFKKLQKARRL